MLGRPRRQWVNIGPTLYKSYTHVLCLLGWQLLRFGFAEQSKTMTVFDSGFSIRLWYTYVHIYRHDSPVLLCRKHMLKLFEK